RIEAAHRLAHRSGGQTQIAGYVHHGKVQAEFADDERMAQEIGVNGAVPDGEAETRGKNIFKLHPEEFGVEYFVWHWFVLKGKVEGRRQKKRSETAPQKQNAPTEVGAWFSMPISILDP